MQNDQREPSFGMSRRERRTRRRRRSFDAVRVCQPEPQAKLKSELQTHVSSVTDFDKAYFDCYAHIGVHEEMIKDRVRTDAYKAAIMHHKDFIKDKTVLDVGCGTGILSIFCAQAGAKRVYAVEASNIALQASSVVRANKLSNIILVLHARVEDVEINEKVDVIISEWMGYMLLYESMLGSVITARDRWLKPGGLILPTNATLYMAPITHTKRYCESIDFWRNVYGINMSPMIPLARQCAFEEPSVETITKENVLTLPHMVKYVNCYSISISELESITTSFKLNSLMKAPLHGFAFWFDVEFTWPVLSPTPINFMLSTTAADNHSVDADNRPVDADNNPVDDSGSGKRKSRDPTLLLSTSPEEPATHWQQTLVYFYEPMEVEQDQVIEGKVTLSQSEEHARFMNIHLEYSAGGHSHVKESVMR